MLSLSMEGNNYLYASRRQREMEPQSQAARQDMGIHDQPSPYWRK